jgi:hypothetical protein
MQIIILSVAFSCVKAENGRTVVGLVLCTSGGYLEIPKDVE